MQLYFFKKPENPDLGSIANGQIAKGMTANELIVINIKNARIIIILSLRIGHKANEQSIVNS